MHFVRGIPNTTPLGCWSENNDCIRMENETYATGLDVLNKSTLTNFVNDHKVGERAFPNID